MKKVIIIIILIFTTINLSSCNKLEIDELAIVTGFGIDRTDQGFEVSLQILDSLAMHKDSPEASPVILISEFGRTIEEAVTRLSTIINNRLYYPYFQVLIFGEELAKQGINPYLNFFSEKQETVHDYFIVVAKESTAKDILTIITSLNRIPTVSTERKVVGAMKYYGIAKKSFYDDLINELKNEGVSVTLTSVIVEGDVKKGSKEDNIKTSIPDALIKVSTIAVFKEDKLIGYLSESESLGFNYVMNNIKRSMVVITKENGTLASIEVNNIQSKVKISLEKNDLKIKINIKCIGKVSEDTSKEPTFELNYLKDLENKVSYEIKKMVEEAIKKSKEYNSDIFGFGKKIHQFHPKYWQTIKDNYDEIYPNLRVEITVENKIVKVKQ